MAANTTIKQNMLILQYISKKYTMDFIAQSKTVASWYCTCTILYKILMGLLSQEYTYVKSGKSFIELS